MEAIDFNKLSTESKKKKYLSNCDFEQKFKLLEEMIGLVNQNLGRCVLETGNKLINIEYTDIDDKIVFYDNLASQTYWYYRHYTYKEKCPNNLFQWDIFYADLGYNIGCEKNKNRPVIILQNTKDYLDAKTIMVAPITTGEITNKEYVHEIELKETKNSTVTGIIDLSQIRSISKSRLSDSFTDRLLNDDEYEILFEQKGKKFETIQNEIKRKLKYLFCIDI